MASLRIVPGTAAAALEADRRYLVVADLHLGFEDGLGAGWVRVGRNTTAAEATAEVGAAMDRARADALVLLGDVKSGTGSISRSEWDGVPRFLEAMAGRGDTILVPGNHDAGIQRMVPRGTVVSGPSGVVIGDALLTHGHALPSESMGHVSSIVMGHAHPAYRGEGSLLDGQRVWVTLRARRGSVFPSRGGELEITVAPSFNRYLYASRRRPRARPASPILERALPGARARIVTLDGAVIGDESALGSVL